MVPRLLESARWVNKHQQCPASVKSIVVALITSEKLHLRGGGGGETPPTTTFYC